MYVIKRDGRRESVYFDKITKRLEILIKKKPCLNVDPLLITQKAINGVFTGVSTKELDILTAETSAYMSTQHPDYGLLAARIVVSNLHKETSSNWEDVVDQLFYYINPKTQQKCPLISEEVYKCIKKNIKVLEKAIDYERDYNYDFFGFKTLQRSYLIKIDEKIVERPQHMLMRVSIGIHLDDLQTAIKTYDLMSQGWYTHATPTLFNSGTPFPQMSSCFLLTMNEDSIEGIYETLKQCALISKYAGGIGLSVHTIRASQSYIHGTNGLANGLVPMLRVFNDTARYVDQGGGKRKGAFAVYLEPWHFDIQDFLDLKKNHGKEESRARDLFYGLWIPDLFMKRVENDDKWSLFCPNEAKGLCDVWGEEFERLYEKYEKSGKMRKVVKARDIWFQIIENQIETGTPYMVYKDAANRKSNQKNLGTIRSSNLCTEILEYTSPDEIAVCNLASIALPCFCDTLKKTFDFQKLYEVAYHVTISLNKVIDRNYYAIPQTRNSNIRHRPVGMGVQGLADTFLKLSLPFDSDEAKKLNRDIFETIYFAGVSASNDIAKRDGFYETFPGSPASKGIFQFDMWNVKPSDRWNWTELKQSVIKHGMRNSLLVAPMPTASTSQILGNNECFEPFTSNIYTRRCLAGEFTIVNKFLIQDLIDRNLWNDDMRNRIIANQGSVQSISGFPKDLKQLYRTVWEIKQKDIIDMAADRGAFIDQSQSLNIFMSIPTKAKVTSMHFYAWKKGLKTGMYYLRTKPATNAIQFTVDHENLKKNMFVNNSATNLKEEEEKDGSSMTTLSLMTFNNNNNNEHSQPSSSSVENEKMPISSSSLSFAEREFGVQRLQFFTQETSLSSTTQNNNDNDEGCLMCGS